jgi:hypothetical protein
MANTEISDVEQRNIAAKFLHALIETTANKTLRIGIVLVEDHYERAFGDGKTICLQRAFWSFTAASSCVDWIKRNQSPDGLMLEFQARDVEVSVEDKEHWILHPLDGEELDIYSMDLESAVIGNAFDWRLSLSYAFGYKSSYAFGHEPDFGDIPPNGWKELGLKLKD